MVSSGTRARGAHRVSPSSVAPSTQATLALVARRLRACHSMAEFAQLVAECALEVLGASEVAVGRLDHDRLRALWIVPPVVDPELSRLSDTALSIHDWPTLRRIVAEPRPVQLAAGDPQDERAARLLARLGRSTMLAAPIVVNGSVWGLILATRATGEFAHDELAAAELVAALAEAALIRIDFENQVYHLVAEDPLTGLADRRVADAAAESALASGAETCIVMCDVDGLKQVNDELGHGEGDELLRLVGDVLRRAVVALPGAVAARIGGDEFCLVVPGWPRQVVDEVMMTTVDEFPLPHGAAISWGSAATTVQEPATISSLFRAADFAQYRVKRARARRKQLALPDTADPATTAQQLLSRAVPAILPARGVLGRLCAVAATATDTLGGGSWTVLRAGDQGVSTVVARGGSPAGDEDPSLSLTVQVEGWQLVVGASTETSRHPLVRTAVIAAIHAAVEVETAEVISPVELERTTPRG